MDSTLGLAAGDDSGPPVWGIPWRRFDRVLLPCFSLLVLAVILSLGYQVHRGLHFDTDLRALLPGASERGLQQAAADRLLSLGGDHAVLMVTAGSAAGARRAAGAIVRGLAASSYWKPGQSAVDDARFPQFVDTLKHYRFHLLAEEQKLLLQREAFAQLATAALYQLYQPTDWARIIPPGDDPLNLFGQWLRDRQPGPAGLRAENGYLLTDSADASGRYYAIVPAELLVDPFALDTQQRAVAEIDSLLAVLPEGTAALRSGVLFHTARAAAAARREVSVIGLGSVIGIVMLYLLSFRSARPLGLSLCAIGFGSMAALATVHGVFGSVHLITLVFGASLIGVAVDYALHFLSRLYHTQTHHTQTGDTRGGSERAGPGQVTPRQAIAGVFPGITLALLTTIIGYLCLLQSDMPGLYQIALFSLAGLVAAWLFVAVLFPRLFRAQPAGRHPRLAAMSVIVLRLWQIIGRRRAIAIVLMSLVALAALGAMSAQFSRDVRTLYAPSPELLGEARAIQGVLGAFAPNQFFVVTGENPQAVLEAEEGFRGQLDGLIAAGAIAGFDQVSTYLPSIATQRENYGLLKDRAYGPAGGVAGFMRDLGMEGAGITRHLSDFSAAEGRYLRLADWQAKAPDTIRGLWLGPVEGVARAASIIALRGVEDVGALQRSAQGFEHILFVDRVAEISSGLLAHSLEAAVFLSVAFGVIGVLLLLRYRRLSALLLLLIPLLSSVAVLALLSGLGIAITLFHLFGLFLVLGLGMDYGLFIWEAARGSSPASPSVAGGGSQWIAINLSAMTSCLSFGLMSLSTTPMVSAFGTAVLVGSLGNLLLAPAVTVLANTGEGAYV